MNQDEFGLLSREEKERRTQAREQAAIERSKKAGYLCNEEKGPEERRKLAIERLKIRTRYRPHEENDRDWGELFTKVWKGLGILIFLAIWISAIVILMPPFGFGFALVIGFFIALALAIFVALTAYFPWL